ncbi:hypothetical protein NC651_023603 [Populus alba x Populus x berolinensis]|nr:hypothetical protein NC651_023603 [Populus alba x Populus x berolinensis]
MEFEGSYPQDAVGLVVLKGLSLSASTRENQSSFVLSLTSKSSELGCIDILVLWIILSVCQQKFHATGRSIYYSLRLYNDEIKVTGRTIKQDGIYDGKYGLCREESGGDRWEKSQSTRSHCLCREESGVTAGKNHNQPEATAFAVKNLGVTAGKNHNQPEATAFAVKNLGVTAGKYHNQPEATAFAKYFSVTIFLRQILGNSSDRTAYMMGNMAFAVKNREVTAGKNHNQPEATAFSVKNLGVTAGKYHNQPEATAFAVENLGVTAGKYHNQPEATAFAVRNLSREFEGEIKKML